MGNAATVAPINNQRTADGFNSPAKPIKATTLSTPAAVARWRRNSCTTARARKNMSQAAANCRSTRGVGLSGRWNHFMGISVGFKGGQVFGPFGGGQGAGHLFFAEDKIFQHQHVHVRGQKTAQGLGR